MIPAEKANDLVEKFHQAMVEGHGGGTYSYVNRSKACAARCVDEILQIVEGDDFDFWLSVKAEIRKLQFAGPLRE